jgi:glucose-6-phosphate 1-dehydrogenase
MPPLGATLFGRDEGLMPDLRQSCTMEDSGPDARPSDALILFGAMGDLAHRKIFPALYHMVERGRLDDPVIGVARAGRTNEHLKERVGDSVQQHVKRVDQQVLAKLLGLLRYVGGDYREPATFDHLRGPWCRSDAGLGADLN